jgi:hypothetical protein
MTDFEGRCLGGCILGLCVEKQDIHLPGIRVRGYFSSKRWKTRERLSPARTQCDWLGNNYLYRILPLNNNKKITTTKGTLAGCVLGELCTNR